MTYITRTGQNIYDICTMLYGSVEGLMDLLLSNTSMAITDYGPKELEGKPLTLDTTLRRGIVLNYHDISLNDTVRSYISDNKVIIANGEHAIDLEHIPASLIKCVVVQNGKWSSVRVNVASGALYIDWGDYNTDKIEAGKETTVEHVYKSFASHKIRIYGDFECDMLDFSDLNGVFYVTSEIRTKTFISNNKNTVLLKLIKTS